MNFNKPLDELTEEELEYMRNHLLSSFQWLVPKDMIKEMYPSYETPIKENYNENKD